jgi:hypothetical protein
VERLRKVTIFEMSGKQGRSANVLAILGWFREMIPHSGLPRCSFLGRVTCDSTREPSREGLCPTFLTRSVLAIKSARISSSNISSVAVCRMLYRNA